jgi:hypothetical protein
LTHPVPCLKKSEKGMVYDYGKLSSDLTYPGKCYYLLVFVFHAYISTGAYFVLAVSNFDSIIFLFCFSLPGKQ